jgi:hypothetical protein
MSYDTRKTNWTGFGLKALGNISRSPEILEQLYEESCNIAHSESCARDFPQIFVNARHVHAAASVVQRRINEQNRIHQLAIENRKAVSGGAA